MEEESIFKVLLAEAKHRDLIPERIPREFKNLINGIPSHSLEVRQSEIPNAGQGVFSKGKIKQGEIVGLYPGLYFPRTLYMHVMSDWILYRKMSGFLSEEETNQAKAETLKFMENPTWDDKPISWKIVTEHIKRYNTVLSPYAVDAGGNFVIEAEILHPPNGENLTSYFYEKYAPIKYGIEDITWTNKSALCCCHFVNHSKSRANASLSWSLVLGRKYLPFPLDHVVPIRAVMHTEPNISVTMVFQSFLVAERDIKDGEEIFFDYGYGGPVPDWYNQS
jgi:hypothetical protein